MKWVADFSNGAPTSCVTVAKATLITAGFGRDEGSAPSALQVHLRNHQPWPQPLACVTHLWTRSGRAGSGDRGHQGQQRRSVGGAELRVEFQ